MTEVSILGICPYILAAIFAIYGCVASGIGFAGYFTLLNSLLAQRF